jgi:hypothetical protein
MTLKTLKQKANISLILDEEFLKYCEINNIEDIEKLAKETFKKGFDLLKYGEIPIKSANVMVENRYPKANDPIKKEEPEIVEAIPMKSSDGTEVFSKIGKNIEKKDLYDE